MTVRLATGLISLVVSAFAASMLLGPASIPPGAALAALAGDGDPLARLILLEVRLPRALLALAIGAGLGLAGAALQGLLQNPLAEPGLIGAGPAAALGAVLAFYFGAAAAFPLALPLGGIAGALAATALVWTLAGRAGDAPTLILAGVAISSLAGALTALALNFAPNPFAASEMIFWMMGSLADRSMQHVWLAAPFIAVGAALLLRLGRALDALTLGAETARSLGVDLKRTAAITVFGAALAVGAGTAVAGAIGFVGLAVPHVLRPLVRHRPGALLPASALGGAALLCAADIVARVAAPAEELKLGVLTALIGAPFFLALVLRMRGGRV